MEKSLKSIAVNYGLYLGGILTVTSVLAYAIDLSLYTKWWFGIALLLVVIIFGIISTSKVKHSLNRIISFKDAFTAYFITVVIGIIISAIISIVIFNFIDPEAAATLQQLTLETQVDMMRGFGAPEEAIAQAVEKIEESGNLFSIGNVMQSLVFQIIGYSIVGLIVALVMKKNPENV